MQNSTPESQEEKDAEIIRRAMSIMGQRKKTMTEAAVAARRNNGAKGGRPRGSTRSRPVTVRFQDRSPRTYATRTEALTEIRQLAGVRRLWRAEGGDGVYVYVSYAERKSDDTGSRAFAVISYT